MGKDDASTRASVLASVSQTEHGEMTARTDDGDVGACGGVEAGAPLIEAIVDLGESLKALDDVPEQAYRLHMRGYSLRAIAARLGINKDTVGVYIRQVERELAPARAEKRERLRKAAERRLLHLRREAWAHYELTGELGALSTARQVEESLMKLHGLHTAEDATGGGGVQVTIRYVNDWRQGVGQVRVTTAAAVGENDSHDGASQDADEGEA